MHGRVGGKSARRRTEPKASHGTRDSRSSSEEHLEELQLRSGILGRIPLTALGTKRRSSRGSGGPKASSRSLSRSRSRDPQNPPPPRDGGVPRFPAPSVQEAIKKLSHVLRDRTKNFRLKDYLEPEELISGQIWEEEEDALVDCVRDRLDDGDGEDGIWRVERKARQLRKQAQQDLAKREGRE